MHKNSKETKERSSQWTLQALQFDFYYILTVMIEIKLSFFWVTFCSWVPNKQTTTTKKEAAPFFHRLTMIEMTKSSHCCVKIVKVSHSETKEEKWSKFLIMSPAGSLQQFSCSLSALYRAFGSLRFIINRINSLKPRYTFLTSEDWSSNKCSRSVKTRTCKTLNETFYVANDV